MAVGANGEDAGVATPFTLSPNERALWGVRFEDDTMSVGPTGGAWMARLSLATLTTFVGLGFVIAGLNPGSSTYSGFPVQNGDPLMVLGAGVTSAGWFHAYQRLRQRITCSPAGLSLRYGVLRSVSLVWDRLVDVRLGECRWERWGLGPSPSSIESGCYRPVTQYYWPVVVTADKWIDVHGLATAETSEV